MLSIDTVHVFFTPSPCDLASIFPCSIYARIVRGVTPNALAATSVFTHPEEIRVDSASSPRRGGSSIGVFYPYRLPSRRSEAILVRLLGCKAFVATQLRGAGGTTAAALRYPTLGRHKLWPKVALSLTLTILSSYT
jgi:hypothetical protein